MAGRSHRPVGIGVCHTVVEMPWCSLAQMNGARFTNGPCFLARMRRTTDRIGFVMYATETRFD